MRKLVTYWAPCPCISCKNYSKDQQPEVEKYFRMDCCPGYKACVVLALLREPHVWTHFFRQSLYRLCCCSQCSECGTSSCAVQLRAYRSLLYSREDSGGGVLLYPPLRTPTTGEASFSCVLGCCTQEDFPAATAAAWP